MKTWLLIIGILFSFMNGAVAQNPDIITYVNTYREIAIREEQRTGVPASIALAQGILETEAGTSDLVKRSNNHFGIKCKDYWKGEKVYHDDDLRGECFRKYPSAEDSYRDHSDFLRGSTRYESLFKLDPEDYKAWAWGLKKAGYATNPKYSQQLIKYIEDYDLQIYTLVAIGKKQMTNNGPLVAKNNSKNGNPVQTSTQSSSAADSNMPPVLNNIDSKATPSPETPPLAKPVSYPDGEFRINDTKVIYAKKGTALLAISDQYDVRLKHVVDFNDLDENINVLEKDQLIYLQRKRKHGENDFHIVEEGETLYDISQKEGVRLSSLMKYNLLEPSMEPASGERLFLKTTADARPVLVSERPPKKEVAVIHEAALQAQKHVVQTRETLYSIAKKYDVKQEQIREWNRLTSDDLKVGQELIIYKN